MQTVFKFIAATGLLLTSLLAEALPESLNPIVNVTPYSQSDQKEVVVFFKYNCPYCKKYHFSFLEWGKTLPSPLIFKMHPVVEAGGGEAISEESSNAAFAHLTATTLGLDPWRFAEGAYEIGISKSAAAADVGVWTRLLYEHAKTNSTPITKQAFMSAINKSNGDFQSTIKKQMHYSIEATPSLLICGRWLINTNSANGNQDMFFRLANGLVSKCITELGAGNNAR